MSKSYYDILEIPKTATDEDIKKAYKKLAKKWHPDKNPENAEYASEKFKAISEANNILSDPEKRKMYDLTGKTDFTDAGQEHGFPGGVRFSFGSGGGGAEHIFRNFFGGGMSFKCEPMKCQLGCTLEELYTGATKKLKMSKGKSEEVIEIKILPGWKEGTNITFEGKGKEEPGRQAGDLVFSVKELPHKMYKRDGNNLSMTMNVNGIKEVMAGFSRTVKFLDGTDISIDIPPLKRSDHVHCVKGKGMPIRMKGELKSYGDLYISFIIVFQI
jgi:DnaJ family protein B protein 4